MSKTTNDFEQLNLPQNIVSTLKDSGYSKATDIQKGAIPILMDGSDLIAKAQTGTGKTAAFSLPILANIDTNQTLPQALVIAPTRELAIQVAKSLKDYAKNIKGFYTTCVYGGQAYSTQINALRKPTHVLVATPGRLIDLMKRKNISLKNIKTVVLDEADEMLKMGFISEIEWILSQIEHPHQRALFSATLPPAIMKIASSYLKEAKKVEIKTQSQTANTVKQSYIYLHNKQKLTVLKRFMDGNQTECTIIFTKTKHTSNELAKYLQENGYRAAALNGDIAQDLREQVIRRLKRKELDVVVATDVAARGLDIAHMSHVINYDMPDKVDSYVHRIGRTGRAGRHGCAVSFVTQAELKYKRIIEKTTNTSLALEKLPTLADLKVKKEKILIDDITRKATLIDKCQLKGHQDLLSRLSKKVGDNNVSSLLVELFLDSMGAMTEEEISLPIESGDFEEHGFHARKGRRNNSRSRSKSRFGAGKKFDDFKGPRKPRGSSSAKGTPKFDRGSKKRSRTSAPGRSRQKAYQS